SRHSLLCWALILLLNGKSYRQSIRPPGSTFKRQRCVEGVIPKGCNAKPITPPHVTAPQLSCFKSLPQWRFGPATRRRPPDGGYCWRGGRDFPSFREPGFSPT